ncbi:hypothetical protein SAMN05443252_105119 [Bacillus sp. OV322]|nr:hypothetical protein SAMN05443252_105119 [Bacillus sp. OV322]
MLKMKRIFRNLYARGSETLICISMLMVFPHINSLFKPFGQTWDFFYTSV